MAICVNTAPEEPPDEELLDEAEELVLLELVELEVDELVEEEVDEVVLLPPPPQAAKIEPVAPTKMHLSKRLQKLPWLFL